ncbi:MAG: hypothetical protein SPK77_07465, partial [Lachnospiraceae bacterium]|nr:hypothetical protein [Lachnospiraceae bacterium]
CLGLTRYPSIVEKQKQGKATVPPFGAAFLLRVAGYLPFTIIKGKELVRKTLLMLEHLAIQMV